MSTTDAPGTDGTGTDTEEHPEAPAPAAPGPAGRPAWATLRQLLRPRLTRAQLLTALLCALLGFAVVAQLRQTRDDGLSTLRQSELVGILDQTTRQGDDLQREIAELEATRQELVSGTDSRQAALDAATRSAAVQGILTGRLPAEGPGIVLTLTEPDGAITYLSLLNVLETLRNAGAEAIQLNDVRLTGTTYFAPGAGGVEVDGTVLHAPYRWVAIGNPDVMASALDIVGGALAAVRNDGGHGLVSTGATVEVTATKETPTPRYATPQPAPSS
ncbi:DUF881 domain-containing protein [Cellulomonas sp. P22]|uniref:DUF881 domain-containing protein n=1 Tax=Cellulomonas sp. P22 TaxID=3373189 RepID=UPI0037B0A074